MGIAKAALRTVNTLASVATIFGTVVVPSNDIFDQPTSRAVERGFGIHRLMDYVHDKWTQQILKTSVILGTSEFVDLHNQKHRPFLHFFAATAEATEEIAGDIGKARETAERLGLRLQVEPAGLGSPGKSIRMCFSFDVPVSNAPVTEVAASGVSGTIKVDGPADCQYSLQDCLLAAARLQLEMLGCPKTIPLPNLTYGDAIGLSYRFVPTSNPPEVFSHSFTIAAEASSRKLTQRPPWVVNGYQCMLFALMNPALSLEGWETLTNEPAGSRMRNRGAQVTRKATSAVRERLRRPRKQ